jgi:hypothetical protein
MQTPTRGSLRSPLAIIWRPLGGLGSESTNNLEFLRQPLESRPVRAKARTLHAGLAYKRQSLGTKWPFAASSFFKARLGLK